MDQSILLPGLVGAEEHYGRPVRVYRRRPQNLGAVFSAAAARNPEKAALVAGDRRWSYGQLWSEVQAAAAALHGYGIRKGDRVALLTGNVPEFCLLTLAALQMGTVVVPLNNRLQPGELVFMLRNSGARILAVSPDQWEKTAQVVEELPALEAVLWAGPEPAAPGTRPVSDLLAGAEPPVVAVGEDDPAFICYTSGTTGLPKGALLTHLNVIHSLLSFELVTPIGPDDVTLIGVPIFHITGLVAQFLTFMYLGATVVLQPLPFRPGPGLELMEREGVTMMFGVPTLYIMLLNHPDLSRRDLSRLRLLNSGGAPLPPDVVRSANDLLPQAVFTNFYGLTETASPATYLPPAYGLAKPGAIGLPLPVTELRVVGADGRDVESGQVGELWLRGPMILKEYWQNPEATTRAITPDGWFATGDLVWTDVDGFTFVMDRLKDMINRGGEKIYSVEVENTIYQHPKVLEVAVLAESHPFYGEAVKAVVVLQPEATATAEEITGFVRERLADYKVPSVVEFRGELPRNPGGKVMKHLLRSAGQTGRSG